MDKDRRDPPGASPGDGTGPGAGRDPGGSPAVARGAGAATEPPQGSEGEPLRIPVEDRIDLHAFAPKDVPSVVAEYVEAAARAGFRQVRIIHGKGTGAQRTAVRTVLSRHPLVASFGDAPPEAGGFGATVAVLRAPTS